MSQKHLDFIIESLSFGIDESIDKEGLLDMFSISKDSVLGISDEYEAVDEDEYCPLSDIPESITTDGIFYVENECWLTFDNGMSLAGFKFLKD